MIQVFTLNFLMQSDFQGEMKISIESILSTNIKHHPLNDFNIYSYFYFAHQMESKSSDGFVLVILHFKHILKLYNLKRVTELYYKLLCKQAK
jgi:hypothetical protein